MKEIKMVNKDNKEIKVNSKRAKEDKKREKNKTEKAKKEDKGRCWGKRRTFRLVRRSWWPAE